MPLLNERCKCLYLIHCAALRLSAGQKILIPFLNKRMLSLFPSYSSAQLQLPPAGKLLNRFITVLPRLTPVTHQELIPSLHIARR